MTKEEIIKTAESMGYRFDFEIEQWLRFCLPDDIDEPELRWIWWLDNELTDQEQIKQGLFIKSRGDKKRKIQEFLKY